MLSKIVDVTTSLCKIKDNAIIAISGFNMATTPEYLILELYRRYVKEGHPKNIFIISDALPASPGRALDHIAELQSIITNAYPLSSISKVYEVTIPPGSAEEIEAVFPEPGSYVGNDHDIGRFLQGAGFVVLATDNSTSYDHPQGTWISR